MGEHRDAVSEREQEDASGRERWLVAALAAVLVTLQLASQSGGDARKMALIIALGGGTLYLLLSRAGVLPPASSSSSAPERGKTGGGKTGGGKGSWKHLDNDLYTLRVPFALNARPPRHLSLRGNVTRALAALRPLTAHSRGAVGRAVALLEDFYVRYDAALLSDDGALARRTAPVLMDTRAEALNTLHTLHLTAAPQAHARLIESARRVVRHDTQRCIGTLRNKHGEALRGLWLQPPYASDDTGRRGTSYHVHY
jgi:hypothetical protein